MTTFNNVFEHLLKDNKNVRITSDADMFDKVTNRILKCYSWVCKHNVETAQAIESQLAEANEAARHMFRSGLLSVKHSPFYILIWVTRVLKCISKFECLRHNLFLRIEDLDKIINCNDERCHEILYSDDNDEHCIDVIKNYQHEIAGLLTGFSRARVYAGEDIGNKYVRLMDDINTVLVSVIKEHETAEESKPYLPSSHSKSL